jgi:hypothetical protein
VIIPFLSNILYGTTKAAVAQMARNLDRFNFEVRLNSISTK